MHFDKQIYATREKTSGYSIGMVSRRVNLSQKTLRDYEKMGLIKPKRDPRTNNRIYTDFEIAQIQQISYLIHNEGFTLPCLRRLLKLAPCWNIFDCPVKVKCSAYKHPTMPCYEIRKTGDTLCNDPCDQCAVFINRSVRIERVLEQPASYEEL